MVHTVRLIVFAVALYVLLVPMRFGRPLKFRKRDYFLQLWLAVVLALAASALAGWLYVIATSE